MLVEGLHLGVIWALEQMQRRRPKPISLTECTLLTEYPEAEVYNPTRNWNHLLRWHLIPELFLQGMLSQITGLLHAPSKTLIFSRLAGKSSILHLQAWDAQTAAKPFQTSFWKPHHILWKSETGKAAHHNFQRKKLWCIFANWNCFNSTLGRKVN